MRTYVCVCFYVYIRAFSDVQTTGSRRRIGCRIFVGHFQQNSPIISESLAKNDLQLKTSYESPPPCTDERLIGLGRHVHVYTCKYVHIYIYIYMQLYVYMYLCIQPGLLHRLLTRAT